MISGSLAADRLAGESDGIKIDGGHIQIAVQNTCPIDISRHCVQQAQQITVHLLTDVKPNPDSSVGKVDLVT